MSLMPTIYSSTDGGSPALTGQPGSLAALLDACLVSGYGAGSSAKAPLGWTRSFTGGNVRVYRNEPVAGSGYSLRVDDSGVIGNARHAFLRAYETMSGLDTGVGPTPLAADRTDGCLWPKSTEVSTAARAWWLIGNDRCFYLFVAIDGSSIDQAVPYFAGDIDSQMPSDQHCFVVSDSGLQTYDGSISANVSALMTFPANGYAAAYPAVLPAGFIGRRHDRVVGAVAIDGRSCPLQQSNAGTWGGSGVPYPHPVNGGMLLARGQVCDLGGIGPRGHMPGLYVPQHDHPLMDLQTIGGLTVIPGATLVAKSFRTGRLSSPSNGQVLFLVDGEWV
ncbi:hypothetical protein [Pseudoxanthomonas sp. USHLN014]|uniref:hypothetical protein n=1 Tax=Pseudoxanthomonas sp. USHLN014 TaxID=3081297 RepID=UPI00301E36CF